MFKKFKEKLKSIVSSIGKKIEKQAKEEEKPVKEIKQEIKEKVQKEAQVEKPKIKKEEPKRIPIKEKVQLPEPDIEKKDTSLQVDEGLQVDKGYPLIEEVKEAVTEDIKEKIIEERVEKEEKKLGIFGRFKEKIITKKISEDQFNNLFNELEITLLENNVALEVIEKIKNDLKQELVDRPLPRKNIEKTISNTLKKSIQDVLIEPFDLIKKVKEKKPFIIIFIGINGSGKTTTIAKVAHLLQNNKLKCVLGAADSFRTAAIEQLETWGKKLKLPVVKGQYGADPASIAFDTCAMAKARNLDVALIDTAGRLQSNKNLIRELEKIIRISKPDLKLYIGESLTGNDVIDQIKEFEESVGIDAVILTKTDVDDKGGTAISISYTTGKPIIYLGSGQTVKDLEPFDKSKILASLGL